MIDVAYRYVPGRLVQPLRFDITVACSWSILLLTAQLASAEAGDHVAARGLEAFLQSNYLQSASGYPRIHVNVDSGIITVELNHDSANCTPGIVIERDIVVDVRALRTDPASVQISTRDQMMRLRVAFRDDVVEILNSAAEGQETLIAEARAKLGWGATAAIESSKEFEERYREALTLYHEVDMLCSEGRSVQISTPYEWGVTLKASADASEFVDLLRRYQASLPLK